MKTQDKEINEVAIIGAGPAGISCAIQLSRYGINPIFFEKKEIGGLLKNANLVENYIGFPGGISGVELVSKFKKQLKKTNLNIINEEVIKAEFESNLFCLKTKNRLIKSKILVLASGTTPNLLELNNSFSKVFYEVYDLREVKNSSISIIGAGDVAFDYAINLAKRNNKVCIFNRASKIKALPLLIERVSCNKQINYRENMQIKEITETKQGLYLKFVNTSSGKEEIFYPGYILAAIGRRPANSFVENNLKEMYKNLADKNLLFSIGDVKNSIYRQTAICIGDGIKSAMHIYEKLKI